jgi:hypothetical protein
MGLRVDASRRVVDVPDAPIANPGTPQEWALTSAIFALNGGSVRDALASVPACEPQLGFRMLIDAFNKSELTTS